MEDLERYLYNKQKKDINQLTKVTNSLELRPKFKAHYLSIWVRKINNFFKILMV